MPNIYEQVTDADFIAPVGQIRLVKENMNDGQLEILADFRNHQLASDTFKQIKEDQPEHIFTLCDDKGTIED